MASSSKTDLAQSLLEDSLGTLAKQDRIIKRALKDYGMPMSRRQPAGFSTLARIIVDQQISTKAAAAIWKRFKATVKNVNAASILDTDAPDLRAAGLSASKVKTLKALAASVSTGQISLRRFNRQSDEAIASELTAVWGIGSWTAEIYLMFGMGRPDVWPAGDLALRTGWQQLTQSSERIDAAELSEIAKDWQPHRSAAAVLLWHLVGVTRTRAKT